MYVCMYIYIYIYVFIFSLSLYICIYINKQSPHPLVSPPCSPLPATPSITIPCSVQTLN